MNLATLAKQYHADGFVIARSVFTRDEVARMSSELESFIREFAAILPPADIHFEDPPSKAIKSMFRLHERRPYFDALQRDPRVLAIMRAIFPGGDISCDGVMLFAKSAKDGSVTPAHQDNIFQCWKPPLALTATIAIDESTPENGALTVARGSHTLGLLEHKLSGVAGFSRCLVNTIDPARYPDVMLCMKPGDVAFHSVDTVHGSGANRTGRSRRQIGMSYHSTLAERDPVEREKYLRSLKTIYNAKVTA